MKIQKIYKGNNVGFFAGININKIMRNHKINFELPKDITREGEIT